MFSLTLLEWMAILGVAGAWTLVVQISNFRAEQLRWATEIGECIGRTEFILKDLRDLCIAPEAYEDYEEDEETTRHLEA